MYRFNKNVFNSLRYKFRRFLQSASSASEGDKSYSDTLILPKTSFPIRSVPSESESPYNARTTEELYKWQREYSKGPLFVLHDGPPYANGSLHMGHALNKIIKDIIIRYHVLRGRRVDYTPGWDCHGLPIEIKTLQEIQKDFRQVTPDVIRSEARLVAEREMNRQREEFKNFGLMADWSDERTYKTSDHAYEIRQLKVFQRMVEKGLIYRDYRPVHYSPSSRTALAESELIYRDDHISYTAYVTFKLAAPSLETGGSLSPKLIELLTSEGDVRVMVWTTTPWTLSANMGIAVHPEMNYSALRRLADNTVVIIAQDRRLALSELIGPHEVLTELSGTDLIGVSYQPFYSYPSASTSTPILKILPAQFVTSDTGTGLVHCAPAHGLEDYNLFRSLNLLSVQNNLICHVDSLGRFTPSISEIVGPKFADQLVGKEVLKEGSRAVVEQLKELGVLIGGKVQRLKHRYPYDWKTNEPIIITSTSQWFANLDKIKQAALTILSDVSFFPENLRTRLTTFLTNRSEWCISRQRVWGVPIPALHFTPSSSLNDSSTQIFLNTETLSHIIPILQEKGVDHWFNTEVDEFIPHNLRNSQGEGTWSKSFDTMDVWFDSGTSWAHLLTRGIFSNAPDPNKFIGVVPPLPNINEFNVDAPPAKEDSSDDIEEIYYQSDDPAAKEIVTISDVCVEGSDQHRGWFQSLLLTTIAYSTDITPSHSPMTKKKTIIRPFRDLLTHGMVLDEHNKKMSKSIGNIISPLSVISGSFTPSSSSSRSKSNSETQAHGISPLRFWAASVDFQSDVPFGPQFLSQSNQVLQKIRNSARFILGILEGSKRENDVFKDIRRVQRETLSIGDKYILHELYMLDKTCRAAYEQYNFPKIISSLSHFANVSLSSIYFDVSKDVLYADHHESKRRLAIVWVLEKVLTTMTQILAPIVPHLAEEINATRYAGHHSGDGERSVFLETWKNLPDEWYDEAAHYDMSELLRIRTAVLKLLDDARRDGKIKSSLECELEICVNPFSPDEDWPTIKLLEKYDLYLPALFIMSSVTVTRSMPKLILDDKKPEWHYIAPIQPSGPGQEVVIPKITLAFFRDYETEAVQKYIKSIRTANIRMTLYPPSKEKCPRCWMYTVKPVKKGKVCGRCHDVTYFGEGEHYQTFHNKYPALPIVGPKGVLTKENMFT